MTDEREESIRNRAYLIWKEEGCPQGQDLSHWLRAEQEIATRDSSEKLPGILLTRVAMVSAAA